MKKLFTMIIFLLLLAEFASADIGVKEVIINPNEISPGEKIRVSITLENIGDKDIKYISVKLDLANLPFAPVESATEQLLDEIEENEIRQVNFYLIVLPEAEPKIYKIPLELDYNNTNKDTLISITVKSEPELDLILENSEIVKINDNGIIILKLVNLGLTEIKSLRITLLPNLDYEILSTSTIYLNKIDIEDFETAEFTIIPKVKNPKLIFNLNYKDSNNEEYAENKELILNVYTLEEAKKLGLVKDNILLKIFIPIITLIIIYFIYKRFRKRKT